MPPLNIAPSRRYDLACLGRLAVDLYAQQVGARLEDVSSFAKYLGGRSANIAFGVARLGLRAAMVSRVGDEQMGRFLIETLQREGCDTSQVQIDPQRLTGLVLLGLKDRDIFPLLFCRENCADMALDAAGINAAFIADCRALLITGTHLRARLARWRQTLRCWWMHGASGKMPRAVAHATRHIPSRMQHCKAKCLARCCTLPGAYLQACNTALALEHDATVSVRTRLGPNGLP